MPNPENLVPFKKGEDSRREGNGRPKGSRNRSTIAKKWLEVSRKKLNPLTEAEEDVSIEDEITLAQIMKANTGDTNAYKALMDSAHGAPINQTELKIDGLEVIVPGDE
jgi:hypothetical protein